MWALPVLKHLKSPTCLEWENTDGEISMFDYKRVNIMSNRKTPFFKTKSENIYIHIYIYILYIIYTLWLFNIAMDNGPFMDDKHHDLPLFF
jgi:hypothetical protein